MDIGNILHLGIKELRGLMRDPIMLVLILFSFTFSVHMSATGAKDSMHNANIAIVDEDLSPLSTRIIESFQPPYFLPPAMISTPEMDRRMDEGLDTFALNIPPDFQRDLLAGRRPELQLNVDATRMTQAFSGSGYVQQIIASEVTEFENRYRAAPQAPVDLVLRPRFNPELDGGWFQAVMGIINSITMLTIILTGAALIREREHGTIEHLLVMPVTPVEIMLSKIWSMSGVVLVASTLSLVVMVQMILQIPLQGSLALFLLGTVLHLFATASLGIFLATIAGSMPQFGILLMLVLLPLQILSGAQTPRESMPELVQTIMLAAPNTHFVILSQSVLFRGAGIAVVWPQLVALFLIGAVLFAISLRQFRGFLR